MPYIIFRPLHVLHYLLAERRHTFQGEDEIALFPHESVPGTVVVRIIAELLVSHEGNSSTQLFYPRCCAFVSPPE